LLKFVSGLASLGLSRAVLAYVVEASGMEGPVIGASVDRARDGLRERMGVLKDAAIDVELRIGTGDPARELLALASESHVESVVLGSHGRTTFSRLIAGSVSEDLVSSADRPTMIVRFGLLRNVADQAQLASDYGRVLLFPTDFSASAMRALLGVLDMPKGAVSTLIIMHVVDAGLVGGRLAAAEQAAHHQMKTMCDMALEAGLAARCIVRQGDPKRVILRELDKQGGTGLVTGSRGRSGLEQAVVGSVSMALVRQASCPVLIVP
jgi:nucleotide-binding universal stress UspA family protein